MYELQYDRDFVIQVEDFETTSLDVRFDVSRSLTPDANTCEVLIYNMAESVRNRLSDMESLFLRVEAGYNGSRGEIFRTRVRDITSTREGDSWETVIEGGDGERTLKTARIKQKFRSGTKIGNVLRAIANELTTSTLDDVGIGNALPLFDAAQFTETGSAEFQKGTVVSGSAESELTELLKSCGMEWSIQDGEIQVLQIGASLSTDSAVPLLSFETGLIGTPTISSDGILTATSLMNSDLSPGRSIVVSTKRIPEVAYRIETADYVGDTQGNSWYVHFEARPL